MLPHLHVRSWFSFQRGGSSPADLAERAADLGIPALALTDRHGVYGAVRFQKACREAGVTPIIGAEVDVVARAEIGDEAAAGAAGKGAATGAPLVLLAASRTGYTHLCRILTEAHLRDRDAPLATLGELSEYGGDLFCLTGTTGSRLWSLVDDGRPEAAAQWVRRLERIFGDRLSLEIANHLTPGDKARMRKLERLSERTGVPLAATGDVRYARRRDQPRYDLLTCIREGVTVFDPHAARPDNAEAFLRSEAPMRRLIPYTSAWDRAADIARTCSVDLLPDALRTPDARYDADRSPPKQLRHLCREGLRDKYPSGRRAEARTQVRNELSTIHDLKLEDFFLVVREIIQEARRRGIRCAGRGSAANSIVAYLLGITSVDPIEHNLLFERFLHRGRKGTPDIDVDFDSERRDEVIQWMEERFGIEQTAMAATVVTYRLRSALRETAKALGWPPDTIDALTAEVPRRNAHQVVDYRDRIRRHLGDSPLVHTLIQMTASLHECPRHLGLHSGGMILSQTPLPRYTPVEVSANGVRMAQFDKDDIEALGLVKFDVLGLRMLATISEAEEMINRHKINHPEANRPETDRSETNRNERIPEADGRPAGSPAGDGRVEEQSAFDADDLPPDDIRTFNLIRAGKTVGCFQIESQGQLHLLAKHQPETFNDLITEVALFRPGPLQGNMVDPFVRRRRGQERVRYDHPSLKPILRDTYGIILFQEQVLEVAHRFAGMSLEEADDFRSLMSDVRDPGEMENMRSQFVEGAIETHGVDPDTAHEVFDKVSGFVGYGFCRSHAAAFAKTVYQSAYLKAHHPAAFLAAVMQHRPGMYSQMTLEEEARRFGVEIRGPDIHRSGMRFDLEPGDDTAWAIRKPLTAVQAVSAEAAQNIAWARLEGPFDSVEDLYRRVDLDIEALRALARSGALDVLAGSSRRALWEVGVLHERLGPPGVSEQPTLFETPAVREADVPDLPELEPTERLTWDLQTHQAARRHPMTLARRALQDLEIRPVETCYRFGRHVPVRSGGPPPRLTIAGLAILRQRPSTAKGVTFVTLEDETGFIQCIVYPQVWSAYEHIFTGGHLIVRGKLQIEGNWRGLIVEEAWRLDGIFGGYEGHPSASGGRDRWIRSVDPSRASIVAPGQSRIEAARPDSSAGRGDAPNGSDDE